MIFTFSMRDIPTSDGVGGLLRDLSSKTLLMVGSTVAEERKADAMPLAEVPSA